MADPIVMIGAGIGGLSAAIHLATAGHKVVVLEKNAAPGGKMGEIRRDGFRWDTGPSVITMRPVFERLFASAGRKLDDYLQLEPVDPITRYFFRDGSTLDARLQPARMAEQIARYDPRDVDGYARFLAYGERIYRATQANFIFGPPPSPKHLRPRDLPDLLRIDPLRTLDQAVRRHVRSPQMRMLLNRFATYVGANPYAAPATLAVIAHVELSGGVWYPRGGIYRIAETLAALAGELGVELHLNSPVESIEVRSGRATAVIESGGVRRPAAAVLSNVDVLHTYSHLLPRGSVEQDRLQGLARRELSCSGFVLLLGVEGETPALAHHNILFPDETRGEFDDIFTGGVPARDPTLYLAITSKTDPNHAPPGCENWFLLVNAPPASATLDWAAAAPAYRQHLLDRLAGAGLDVRGRIRSEQILTPADFERTTGAWRGALYGISSNRALNAFRRPHNRSREVAGLYFAGGTTHPGGGVPMVVLSGRLAASLLMEDLQ